MSNLWCWLFGHRIEIITTPHGNVIGICTRCGYPRIYESYLAVGRIPDFGEDNNE